MKCINETTGQIIAGNLKMKDSFFSRLVGLLGCSGLRQDEGIVLKPCNQIHTMFMRFSIDVLFVSRDFKVLHVIENMGPWRFSPLLLKSLYTVEVAAGTLKGGVKVGDKVVFKDK